ncbi:hypothetical protein DFJ77DRAFT_261780 [Powellomyces hirtus]|nr:hypothetical protein DFJ77DRAFT_261780 [Powellomyces hirtus]
MHFAAIASILFALLSVHVNALPRVVMKRAPEPAMLNRQVPNRPQVTGTATEEVATATATATAPASESVLPTLIPAPYECRRGGCSSELCVSAGENAVLSPCIYKPEFACYAKAECGYDPVGGTCGWQQTEELTLCIADATSPAL